MRKERQEKRTMTREKSAVGGDREAQRKGNKTVERKKGVRRSLGEQELEYGRQGKKIQKTAGRN